MEKDKLDSRGRFRIKTCPCGKSNRDGKFVPYQLHDNGGYCHSCNKTFPLSNPNPVEDYSERNPILPRINYYYLPLNLITKSQKIKYPNNFIEFLQSTFGKEKANYMVSLYHVGTSKYWPGANIFWYLDTNYRLCTGKIMVYNSQTGKRIKNPPNLITWVHYLMKVPTENVNKGLFGLHLLKLYPQKTIAIVESEKTAIIASIFYPELIWLATGGKGNLTFEKLLSLEGRRIILFPDLGAYDDWSEKAVRFRTHLNIQVSDFLENKASSEEKAAKYDLADYLLRLIVK
jgi:hypothetical protein